MEIIGRFLLNYIPVIINLCLVTIISYYSVYIGLNIYSTTPSQISENPFTNPNASNIIANSQSIFQLDVQPIINAHLFGQAKVKKTQNNFTNKPLQSDDIPETKLKINLQGIYYSDNPNHSFIIVDNKKMSTNHSIKTGVKLYQIQPKHIVLQRNHKFESSKLREAEPIHSQTIAANNTPNTQAPENLLAAYQRQLKTNPEALTQLARIRPAYDEGKLIGYRLDVGKDKSLLSQFNLQVGDILTTVNDVELDSPLKGLSLIQQLSEADQLNLTVLRNGRVHSQSFNIKN
ncbi:type II secretion system protein GspC [Candidatus Albibeggiatoa sp. nov. BB20]|uniref:type II secretion system protein GspC n=1 Tax=Candidatus Albibeggiatoa sp. nov. BB20 TaxID=3162723 RepID=UPI003365A589